MAERLAKGGRPLVVKVGGSLAETGRLPSALAAIKAAHVPVVVVPGGGPFADSVRRLQREMRFSEAVAHRLAMLAMHQMAELMLSLHVGFDIAQSLNEVAGSIERGQIPIWVPLRMIAGDATVPAGWAATSDTLAARLAELLGGAHLVLLKSVDVEDEASAEDLARRGIVDPLFPVVVARAGLCWRIFGPAGEADFATALQGGPLWRASSRRS